MSFQVALVSREVYPFSGGGLGAYVTATANTLAPIAEVTIVTTTSHRDSYDELLAGKDPRLPSPGVSVEFLPEPEPEDVGNFFSLPHVWSARAYEGLKRLYPGGGPDIVEFPDYLGEGAVTVQALKTLDPQLRNTQACLRLYTTTEMCSVLDGYVRDNLETRSIYDLERYALRYADWILWPGGDVFPTYERFYGKEALAPPVLVRHPAFIPDVETPIAAPPGGDNNAKLKFIFLGRLERRKGVQNLVRAFTSLEPEEWELTLVGGDTDTGPLGTSMRQQLQLAVGPDPRITFMDGLPREKVLGLLRSHDVAVLPSLWECWPNAALEAMANDIPIVATPVGGYAEMVKSDRSGWLTKDTSAVALANLVEELLSRPERVHELRRKSYPSQVFAELTDPENARERYESIATRGHRSRPSALGEQGRTATRPLVSIIVTYYKMHDFIEDTIESALNQTYPSIEVLLVNDGSFSPDDTVIAELASRYPIVVLTQQNSGLGAARNTGISQSRGKYFMPLDADDVILPTRVERCVEVLENDPSIAYVTTWSRYIDEVGRPHADPGGGYQPLGNMASADVYQNVAGDASALIRKRFFDLGLRYSEELTSFEDWLLYRQLGKRAMYGHVIPERLLLYRVRPASMIRGIGMQNRKRLLGEMSALIREGETEWKSSNAFH